MFRPLLTNMIRENSAERVEQTRGTSGWRGEFASQENKVKMRMPRRRSPPKLLLGRVLARAPDLAEQVRQTAERVHEQAQEARRLTDIARQQTEIGRELSQAGRDEARAVTASIKESVGNAGKGARRRSDKHER